MKTPYIVALNGPAGGGKSAAADHLAQAHGFEPVKFAMPLKTMLRAFYDTQGLDPHETERRIEGDLKETPDPLLNGHTPRHAMETLGTEWGRICMGDEFWINAWRRKVQQVPTAVVTDDCRFDNEAETVRELGGEVVRLKPAVARRKKSKHVAERGIKDQLVDHEVTNDGTLDDLRWAITLIVDPSVQETFYELPGDEPDV